MKRFLPLLIVTGLLFGQDRLFLKSGEFYTGTFYGKVGEEIVFKVEGETSTKKFSINDVEIIKIKSGELSYPFNVPKVANDIPITNERHETLNYSITNFDILILKSGTAYFGEYSKIEGEIVYFKPQNANSFQPISIKQIQTLKLKNGHFIIGGKLNTKRIVLTCCVITVVIFFLLLFGFDGIDMSGYDLSGHGTAW